MTFKMLLKAENKGNSAVFSKLEVVELQMKMWNSKVLFNIIS